MPAHRYLIGLGSNRRGRHGDPRAEVRAALDELGGTASPIVSSAPIGPSIRRYANAVAMIDSGLSPPDLLAHLKAIEARFGRRGGRRWGARVIDLDILLWSGGAWGSVELTVPHIALRERAFVLGPLAALVPDWRDPVSGLTVRQLHRRLTARRAAPSRPNRGAGS